MVRERSFYARRSFNPRPRVASDGDVELAGVKGALFQSTPACGERRPVHCPSSGRSNVSIHARVWRATEMHTSTVTDWRVSIHARVWRATSAWPRQWLHASCFNPRPRVASDAGWGGICQLFMVSIHARVWRATPMEQTCSTKQSFNPRPRVASDNRQVEGQALDPSFNPRPRVASDPIKAPKRLKRRVSIHARVWRATSEVLRTPTREDTFQSTPACGERQVPYRERERRESFNPRPRVASDWVPLNADDPFKKVSIHARVWRATVFLFWRHLLTMFQSTPACGERHRSP